MDLKIKDENIRYYEIETDPEFNIEALPAEEQEELEKKTDKYIDNEVKQHLMHFIQPCPCRQRELMERAINRSRILGGTPSGQVQVDLTQEDLDMKDFGVAVEVTHSVPDNIRMTVIHCKKCGNLQFFGDLDPVIDLMARGFNDFESQKLIEAKREERRNKMAEKLQGNPDEYFLEDTETGEMTPANDLIKGLLGVDPSSDNFEMIQEVDNMAEEESKVIDFPTED